MVSSRTQAQGTDRHVCKRTHTRLARHYSHQRSLRFQLSGKSISAENRRSVESVWNRSRFTAPRMVFVQSANSHSTGGKKWAKNQTNDQRRSATQGDLGRRACWMFSFNHHFHRCLLRAKCIWFDGDSASLVLANGCFCNRLFDWIHCRNLGFRAFTYQGSRRSVGNYGTISLCSTSTLFGFHIGHAANSYDRTRLILISLHYPNLVDPLAVPCHKGRSISDTAIRSRSCEVSFENGLPDSTTSTKCRAQQGAAFVNE